MAQKKQASLPHLFAQLLCRVRQGRLLYKALQGLGALGLPAAQGAQNQAQSPNTKGSSAMVATMTALIV